METKKLLLEAYRARQQQTMAAGGIPSFYKKACSLVLSVVVLGL
jgi:hypothetical protein